MDPRTMSSILGWVAAVIEIVSPSQPRPAVIQRTSIAEIDGGAGELPSRIFVVSATRFLPGNKRPERKIDEPSPIRPSAYST